MKITDDIYLVGSGQMGLSAELDCHIYLVNDGNEAVLIDSGAGKKDTDVDFIIHNIAGDGVDPNTVGKILLTHAHADHSGGTKQLKRTLNCEVVAHKKTKKYVEKGSEHDLGLDFARRSGFYGDDYAFRTFTVDSIVEDGGSIKVGKSSMRVIHTPGHSFDSICFMLERGGQKALFTGDVLNHGGKILLLNCKGFDLKEYRENIRKLASLNIDMLFPGHGIFTLKNGQSHIDILIDAFDKLLINNQLIM
jgi:glyoxylase-like metal-dependent hydrolase (beta-lactamase superfamily II)